MRWQRPQSLAWIALALLSALILAACTKVTVEPSSGTAGDANTLTSSGEGRVTAPPDFALLTLGVSVLRNSVTDAQAAAAAAMEAVLTELRAQGIDDEDLATTQFNIQPEYSFRSDGERDLLGFRVTNQVSAKIREIERVGDVIDGTVLAAGDDIVVSGVSFSIDDNQPLVDEARRLAVRDAQRKAEQLAELSGLTLGDILDISEGGGAPPAPVFVEATAEAFAIGGEVRTPIEGGRILVSLSVFVTYAIE